MKEKFENLKQKCKQHASKICAAVAGGAVMAGNAISAFAADAVSDNGAAGVAAAQDLIKLVTAEINIANIVAILGAGLGISAATWLAWMGIRKLVRMISAAVAKGKLSV